MCLREIFVNISPYPSIQTRIGTPYLYICTSQMCGCTQGQRVYKGCIGIGPWRIVYRTLSWLGSWLWHYSHTQIILSYPTLYRRVNKHVSQPLKLFLQAHLIKNATFLWHAHIERYRDSHILLFGVVYAHTPWFSTKWMTSGLILRERDQTPAMTRLALSSWILMSAGYMPRQSASAEKGQDHPTVFV